MEEYLSSDSDLSHLSSLVLNTKSLSFQNNFNEIMDLQSKRNQKLLNVTPDHPDILLINAEIKTLRTNILSQIALAKKQAIDQRNRFHLKAIPFITFYMDYPDQEALYTKIKRE
ncbi:MAG: hypothetical protein R2772_06300 [Chitinophagales bacterium]